jgi:uncharacterized protein YecE (DUF72 family)
LGFIVNFMTNLNSITHYYSTMTTEENVVIGTSGWQYADWNGKFYPRDIKGKAQLNYFAERFDTVEVNSTFYHVPRASTLENWSAAVPKGFRFVIKLNRFLTHTKRLTSDDQFTERLQEFLELLKPLDDKLAAILVQLPPSMRVANSRLEYLAEQVRDAEKKLKLVMPLAVEFRHDSWFNAETYALMRKYNLANVINDSPGRWPASQTVTADFAYIRFHGSKRLYRSSYTTAELQKWAEFIQEDCADCRQVLCYFNNDYNATAVHNAIALRKIVTSQVF